MTQTRKNILSLFIILTMIFTIVGGMNIEPTYAATKTPAKVSSLKAKKNAAAGTYNLTWKKAKNAKKYQVYYKVGDKGKWKLYKTLKTTKCVIKRTQWQKKELYKVRAIAGSKKGTFSKTVTVFDHFIKCDQGNQILITTIDPVTLTFTFDYDVKTIVRANLTNGFTRIDSKLNTKDRKYTYMLKAYPGKNTSELRIWDKDDKTIACEVKLQSDIPNKFNIVLDDPLPISLYNTNHPSDVFTITSCSIDNDNNSGYAELTIEGTCPVNGYLWANWTLTDSKGNYFDSQTIRIDDGAALHLDGKFTETILFRSWMYFGDFNPFETYHIHFHAD